MENIVRFPLKQKPRLCSNCNHAFLGQSGVYCSFFREEFWNERVAEECEEYDSDSYVPGKIVNIKDGSR